ncbi:MAG: S8 family serine peptidase, partial [Verrucomicrobiales bacterium]|nr:S8 family serine peptidase [Verrucomicrobiales bacterium]
MKISPLFLGAVSAALLTTGLQAADPPLGRLSDGTLYLANEVEFALKADVARALSPADTNRRVPDRNRLTRLHPGIQEVVATHTAAERWLAGQSLPPALKHTGAEVPQIARSLTARLRPGEDAAQVVAALRQHPDIEWASLNVLHRPDWVPNDTFWTNQWGAARVRADAAWDVPQASTTLRIAIIDTGVDLTHPDLAARITYNRGFGGNANGDARRDVRGGTSIDHGTHVAGIAAAIRDNNLGIAGIANLEIMAMGCAVWDGTNQYLIGSAAAAMNDAVANGAAVINCSFGMPTLDDATRAALDNAQNNNVVVVVAAGNQANDVDNPASGSAGWNQHPWPLIVSNTQNNDALNPSSNFGPAIDLAAPGTTILSTITTNYAGPNPNGNYGNMSGTSMASPCVAGGVGMVRSMNPNLINGT